MVDGEEIEAVQNVSFAVQRGETSGWCSDREGCGLALRFPRIVGDIRKDKSPEDAITVQEIKELYAMRTRTKHN